MNEETNAEVGVDVDVDVDDVDVEVDLKEVFPLLEEVEEADVAVSFLFAEVGGEEEVNFSYQDFMDCHE